MSTKFLATKEEFLTRQEDYAKELAKNLVRIVNDGGFPLEKAIDLAKQTVQKMADTNTNRIRKDSGLRSSYAIQHFGDYFGFKYPDVNGKEVEAQIALGFDCRHWMLTGNIDQIPWRVFLSVHRPPTSPNIPPHVEKKIRLGMRDGFTWVFYGTIKGDIQNQDYPFLLVQDYPFLHLSEQLPPVNDPAYVDKLAKVVFDFLNELYTP